MHKLPFHSSNLQTGKQIYLVVGTLGPGGRVEASVICNGGTDSFFFYGG